MSPSVPSTFAPEGASLLPNCADLLGNLPRCYELAGVYQISGFQVKIVLALKGLLAASGDIIVGYQFGLPVVFSGRRPRMLLIIPQYTDSSHIKGLSAPK